MPTYNGVRYSREVVRVIRAEALYKAGRYLAEHASDIVAEEYGAGATCTDSAIYLGELDALAERLQEQGKRLYPDIAAREERANDDRGR